LEKWMPLGVPALADRHDFVNDGGRHDSPLFSSSLSLQRARPVWPRVVCPTVSGQGDARTNSAPHGAVHVFLAVHDDRARTASARLRWTCLASHMSQRAARATRDTRHTACRLRAAATWPISNP